MNVFKPGAFQIKADVSLGEFSADRIAVKFEMSSLCIVDFLDRKYGVAILEYTAEHMATELFRELYGDLDADLHKLLLKVMHVTGYTQGFCEVDLMASSIRGELMKRRQQMIDATKTAIQEARALAMEELRARP